MQIEPFQSVLALQAWTPLMDALATGVVMIDEAGRVVEANTLASRILGLGRGELLSGRLSTFRRRLVGSSGSPVDMGPATQSMRLGQGIHRETLGWLRAEGDILWLEVSAQPLEDGFTLLSFDDITARSAEAQVRKSNQMESLGVLAGGVAHDMNNVLGAILGLATANLEIQPAGSPTYRAFDTISRAALRGGKMVKSLLNFARNSPVEERVVDLNAIVQEEVSLLEHTTLSRIRLEMDLAPDLQPMRGDAGALAHAVMNLCVNSVDAMPHSGTLRLRTRNLPGGMIEALVEDTGQGMTRDVLDRALDPFFTTKAPGKGTGLGLSMVYSTVKAHQGRMELESEPGRGTRVHLKFPACPPDAPAAEPARAATGRRPSRPLQILVVDDDDLVLTSTTMQLEVLGHGVTPVSGGAEALRRLEAGLEADLVVLDMHMPGMGGAETFERLRALRPGLPVLLATGRADPVAMDLAEDSEGVTILAKPFTLHDLQNHLAARFAVEL
jgi:PAS domain S-box-containing protein